LLIKDRNSNATITLPCLKHCVTNIFISQSNVATLQIHWQLDKCTTERVSKICDFTIKTCWLTSVDRSGRSSCGSRSSLRCWWQWRLGAVYSWLQNACLTRYYYRPTVPVCRAYSGNAMVSNHGPS